MAAGGGVGTPDTHGDDIPVVVDWPVDDKEAVNALLRVDVSCSPPFLIMERRPGSVRFLRRLIGFSNESDPGGTMATFSS